MVREDDTLLGSEPSEREADHALRARSGHAYREREVDGHLEVDIEEVGAKLQRPHVAVEVADVETPQDCPLDLGAAFLAHLVDVTVIPSVRDGARTSTVTVEQAG